MIDENGTQVGIVPTSEALDIARERNLDLVEVQPNSRPPVCRLMDYGRYRYEESRKEREARKNQKVQAVKEIRMQPNIGEHDLQVKLRNARKFLLADDKVKASVRFRGRQHLHRDIGRDLLLRIIEELSDVGQAEQMPKNEGSVMSIIIAPNGQE